MKPRTRLILQLGAIASLVLVIGFSGAFVVVLLILAFHSLFIEN